MTELEAPADAVRLPTGMVDSIGLATFLMTDIEGSTRLWEEAPVAMTVALEAHDAILRTVVESHGGVVVKTTGDGLLAHFDDAPSALAAALAGQLTLDAHAWPQGAALKARMAVHSGSAQLRDGDYFGPALNRVARLLAIGHGRQVLVSGIAAALVGDRLPAEATLIDRGDQRLRDLDQPVRVYELAAPGLARDLSPLRTVGSGRSNLPVQLTSFVGREHEQAEVRRLLGASRLVTLIGTGGTGKTRLALEVAGNLGDAYPDGVWLVELAPVSDPDLVPGEMAKTLGIREDAHAPIETSLADFLRVKSMLILLDNCEHVIAAAAAMAESLLEASPSLSILATSREALGIPGEAILQVPSLAVPQLAGHGHDYLHGAAPGQPETTADTSFATLAASDSVRLFTERAIAVAPSFELTEAMAPTVVEICQRLDGIPLAIELAAARVPVLSVTEILDRLGDRFRLLTGGRRTALPRQQTLQALIDWSWDLLSVEDRQLLRRLSVFAGGWTLEAAAAVCADEPDVLAVLDALTRLVERSLVVVEQGSVTRYRLLETIRQYARDRLVESGETDAVRGRHLATYLAFALEAGDRIRGPEFVSWLRRLDADADNIRLALEWGLTAQPEEAIRLVVALWMYWRIRVGVEFMALLDQAVVAARSLPAAPPAARRERDILISRLFAEVAFSGASWMSRDMVDLADEALALARSTGDQPTIAAALGSAATSRLFSGKADDLSAYATEALEVSAASGDAWNHAMASAAVAGAFSGASHDPAARERARALMDTAANVAMASGDSFAVAFTAQMRGRLAGADGRLDEARLAFGEAAAFYEEIGDARLSIVALSDLGHAVRYAGEFDEALAIMHRTLPVWEHSGNRGAIANQLESIAFIAIERDDTDRAARLLGAAAELRIESGAAMLPHERAEYDAYVERLRGLLDAEALDTAWQAGRSMRQVEAVAYALEA
jgi:predicted ATPase/class 3 adenylate cyclase